MSLSHKLLSLLFLFFVFACESSYNETTDYKGYYDDGMTKKKVEGVINNGEENGEWVFYSEEGYVSQRGYYKNGLLD